ncbi:alkaline phosphatase family protein [Gryllotalpicola daejeonensis]|uniref:Alkaline phosphatase family protein n=1 Tax=Gryllotalpicola daejeonensis TaxID=993087 RepID=A0ABP7ZLL8_9MICO
MFQKARLRRFGIAGGALAVAAGFAVATAFAVAPAEAKPVKDNSAHTTTPIKHLVVIYGENVSFDHYFGTYPNAANTDGTKFTAAKNTPKVNGLTPALLNNNPNEYNPQRLTPAQAVTCDQNHNYKPEQAALNNGAMDQFVQNVSKDTCTGAFGEPGLAMDYYDGNTVTGMWNYAQNYTMSDNSWDATFGPSTPGALNLISGQTHGISSYDPTSGTTNPKKTATPDSYTVVDPDATTGVGTVINDPDPVYDDCADNNHTSSNALGGLSGKNVGDLLNEQGVTWGWFQGGFKPTTTAAASSTGYAICGSTHTNVAGGSSVDYSPHHNPFAYYKSTSNPHHLPPSSVDAIGHTDQANHQYDTSDFYAALNNGNLPAVSFVKAPEYQDGHAAYSDPLDEQTFDIDLINALQKSPEWKSTAVVISYDDSDGWYDHVAPKITNSSNSATNDTTICTTAATKGVPALGGYQDRCGPSQRLPLLVISPYTSANTVSHTLVSQPSILKFVEQNWKTGSIGGGSFDKTATSLSVLFNFSHPQNHGVLLDDKTGAVSKIIPINNTPTHPKPWTPSKGHGKGGKDDKGDKGHGGLFGWFTW